MTKDICIDIVQRYLHSDNADIKRDFDSLMNVLSQCDDYNGLLEAEIMLDGDDEPCAVSDAIVARYATLIINNKMDVIAILPNANWEFVWHYRDGLYKGENDADLLKGLDVTDIPTQVAILYFKHKKLRDDYDDAQRKLKKMSRLIDRNNKIGAAMDMDNGTEPSNVEEAMRYVKSKFNGISKKNLERIEKMLSNTKTINYSNIHSICLLNTIMQHWYYTEDKNNWSLSNNLFKVSFSQNAMRIDSSLEIKETLVKKFIESYANKTFHIEVRTILFE